ncbi:pentatricopeptide repeat-containing protein At1g62720-like [Pistacia vera]|uniref:pentatricopeptide repeat-containing protein At1g62720-like n=1 Tax=Pistacia vera TaxID=55513 RepID=UPI001263DD5A|nr:pentatricopeptide repeat-containing protein At1g62720-like [Pistacia vera]
MVAVGCRLNFVTYNTIIDGLCKDGLIEKARQLLLEMKGSRISPNAVTYTTLIHGLCCVSDWEKGKSLFIVMMNQGVQPFVMTFNVVINELCQRGKLDEANRLLELMIQRGRIGDARELFAFITRKGYTSHVWYCKNKNVNKTLILSREMISEGIKPDVIAYNTLLTGLFLKVEWKDFII